MSSNTFRSSGHSLGDGRGLGRLIAQASVAVLALGWFGSPFVAGANAAESHRITWHELEEYRIAGDGASVSLTRALTVSDDAWPSRVVRIEIPADAVIDHVSLTPIAETPLPNGARVAAERDFAVDLPELPTFEPAGYTVRVLPEGDYLGHRIGHVLVTPFRTDGQTTHFLSEFDLDVDFAFDGGPAASDMARRISHPRTVEHDRQRLALALDVAPRPVDADAGPVHRSVPPPELSTDTTELLVITDETFTAFDEFADFKSKEGIPSRVVSIQWILDNYAGVDLADRVRRYVRDVYLYQGLRYLVLGGDTGIVPTRGVVSRFQDSSGIPIVADKYFAGLDGNWSADGDDELGEAPDTVSGDPGDDADLYPEIVVGRIPVSSAADAATYVQKWKSYTGYDPANFRSDYQDRVLALAEVLFPSDWKPGDDPADIIIDGADIAEETLTYFPPDWDFTRLYQYNAGWPGSLPEDVDSAIAEINTGYGFVDHVGHGFRANMSVGDGKLVNSDADAFSNTNAYSVLYAVNCSSGAILFDCINEHMIENPNGGIIASIAATDLDYPSISDEFKFEFFRLVFDDGLATIGDAFQAADLPWIPVAVVSENAFRWTVMTLTCLGDPSLEMWRESPRSMALAFPSTHEIGDQSITVSVTETGTPVENARVTVSKDDHYVVGTTDVTGAVTLPFSPSAEGDFQVTAVKNSFIPKSSTGTVTPSTTAALRVVDLVYHDGSGGGTGNGDGRPDAGERVVIDLVVRNDGVATATAGSATLTTNSAFLTDIDTSASLPDVSAGSEITVAAAFEVDVTTFLPDSLRHVVIPADIELSAAEGTWQNDFDFSVYQRLLDLTKLTWSILDDNGNGMVDVGETIGIMLTVLNRGEAVAQDVTGVVTFGGADFVIVNDTASFGDLDPGESQEAGPFSFFSTGGNQLTFAADVTFSDVYAAEDLLTRSLDLIAPPAPTDLSAEPGARTIRTIWPLPAAGTDIRGYRVFRSDTPGGTFVEVSEDIVDVGTFFSDEGLTPLTQYVYQVRSVDWSGNEGVFTSELVTSTSPPVLEGWPVPLPSGESKGSPTFADVDRTGLLQEIVIGWNNPMVFKPSGADFVDGDDDAQTAGVFADIDGGAGQFWNSPFVFDLDRDLTSEIAYSAWHLSGESTGYLYIIDGTGAIEAGWPQAIGRSGWGSPAVAELDGDINWEIVLTSGESSGAFRGSLLAFNHDGTEVFDGDGNPATNGILYSGGPDAQFWYGSPAIADLDGDGIDEIILAEKRRHATPSEGQVNVIQADGTSFPGFPYDDGGTLRGSTSSPAIADLDDNGDFEIIAAFDNRLVVVNHDGTEFAGFPYTLPEVSGSSAGIRDFLSSPAIGDIDGNGDLDIALGWLDGELYVWNGVTGALVSGFPASLPVTGGAVDRYLRSPIIGNLDATPEPEVIIPSGPNKLYAVNGSGSLISGFPLTLPGNVFGSAAIWDIDGDGSVNLIVQTDAPELTVYDFDSVPFDRTQHPWPMFRHNSRKNGRYTPVTAVDVDDVDPSSAPVAAVAFPPTPNPFSPRVNLGFAVPNGGDAVKVRVYDVSGREVRVLADGNFPAGEFNISWDGRSANGQRLGAGQYFASIEIGTRRFVQKLTLLR